MTKKVMMHFISIISTREYVDAGLARIDFRQFQLWEGVVVLKGLIFISFTLGGCGGLEWTDFR